MKFITNLLQANWGERQTPRIAYKKQWLTTILHTGLDSLTTTPIYQVLRTGLPSSCLVQPTLSCLPFGDHRGHPPHCCLPSPAAPRTTTPFSSWSRSPSLTSALPGSLPASFRVRESESSREHQTREKFRAVLVFRALDPEDIRL